MPAPVTRRQRGFLFGLWRPADEAARANLSMRETLMLLCEREIARKEHRRIEMALKLAHSPAVKELAGFDFEAQPSIDPKQIRDTPHIPFRASSRFARADSRAGSARLATWS